MRNGLFLKLAITNIRKHKGTYIPYIFTCIGCIAMLYIMLFIQTNPDLDSMRGGRDISMIMFLGILVLGIFSLIFLLYSNGFLMKRRQKEIGLYNILGMEKGHIARMMFLETVITAFISITGGILLGILGSKLALLVLLKLIRLPVQFGFNVSVSGACFCVAAYGLIFLITLFWNLRRVHISRPVELLRGSQTGEREPKAKWLMALAGFVCLGSGYYIAVTTENPITALSLFFVAVLLVMAGTYLLFTAGSIVILKMMRWNKGFYYKLRNFTAVSGMIYRMKQNAVGLASICILSTGVLLMLSSTICLNFGIEDIMDYRYPDDLNLDFRNFSLEELRNVVYGTLDEMEQELPEAKSCSAEIFMEVACVCEDGEIIFRQPENVSDVYVGILTVIPAADYENLTGEKLNLHPGELAAYGVNEGNVLRIMGTDFQIRKHFSNWPLSGRSMEGFYDEVIAVIVTDEDFRSIDAMQREAYDYPSDPLAEIGVTVHGGDEEAIRWQQVLGEWFARQKEEGAIPEEGWISNETRQENYGSLYSLYGGLLFLGILLGGMFLMGTAMIIYYKQTSEGYEDQERFRIMRKVGMSSGEVKSSIHRQILMIFFLPLLMAVVHIVMAFPMIKRLFLLLGMANTTLFVICTAASILVFALIYGVIYGITAKSYYRILQKAE